MSPIAANLQGIHRAIDVAIAGRTHGNANPVKLVAVSKTRSVAEIRAAFEAGQRAFGENYVQEGVEKILEIGQSTWQSNQLETIEWHLIGPLQSNKAKLAAQHFDWVQSVDRSKIADALQLARPIDKPPINMLIQVNISQEAQKGGVMPTDALALGRYVTGLSQLRLRGLMAIVENTNNTESLKSQFAQMATLFDVFKREFQGVDTLSLGMSQDFEVAIAEGSSMIRVGSAIFGARV